MVVPISAPSVGKLDLLENYLYKIEILDTISLEIVYIKNTWSYNCLLRIIIIIIHHPLELFTSALADGFSLESEWQQVSSSLQDSSQYSGRSQ